MQIVGLLAYADICCSKQGSVCESAPIVVCWAAAQTRLRRRASHRGGSLYSHHQNRRVQEFLCQKAHHIHTFFIEVQVSKTHPQFNSTSSWRETPFLSCSFDCDYFTERNSSIYISRYKSILIIMCRLIISFVCFFY